MNKRILGARRRMISTRVSLSKKIASVSWAAEGIYLRLIPHADDAGRLTGDLEELRAVVIPLGKKGRQMSLDTLRKILEELHRAGLVVLYGDENGEYIEITKFNSFQTQKSDRAPTVVYPDICPEMVWNPLESNGIPSIGIGIGINNNAPTGAEYPSWFEELWQTYPRKKEKRSAYNQAAKRVKEGVSPDDLILATTEYAAICERESAEEKYIKLGKTFFGPSRPFEDYVEAAREKHERAKAREEAMRRRREEPPVEPQLTPEEAKAAKERARKMKEMVKGIAAGKAFDGEGMGDGI